MQLDRNGYLWTCQHVGLDGMDGNYGGDETGSTVDRAGIQWIRMAMETEFGVTKLFYSNHGRIYDDVNPSSSAYYYYMPSLMVNATGDVLAGFSGSRSSEYIGAFYSGRKSVDTAFGIPTLIQAGRDYFDSEFWGDYSYTSLDPISGDFWTVQQFSMPHFTPDWYGTWITKIKVNAP